MNLILIYPEEWPTPADHEAEITLNDRRFQYIKLIHKPAVGDKLRVGLLHGKLGSAQVLALDARHIKLRVCLDQLPPQPSPATLILALPRPPVLRRVLQTATTMGVKHIYLIHSKRVEKSFWQSPQLRHDKIQEQLILGMEQAQDTLPPKVYLKQAFKPFVEDQLKKIVTNQLALVAHPKDTDIRFPNQIDEPCCIAIGPEGGFIPYEVELLQAIGFSPRSLGARILKVETAVTVALGRCLI